MKQPFRYLEHVEQISIRRVQEASRLLLIQPHRVGLLCRQPLKQTLARFAQLLIDLSILVIVSR